MENLIRFYTSEQLLLHKTTYLQNLELFKTEFLEIYKHDLINKNLLSEEDIDKLNYQTLNNISFLYYLLQKKIYDSNVEFYTVKRHITFYNRIVYVYLTISQNNTFITLCTENKQKILNYSVGLEFITTQRKKRSYYTMQKLFNKVNNYLYKFQVNRVHLIIKGSNKARSKKIYYEQFLRLSAINDCIVRLKSNRPHGGCRFKKSKRK